MTKIIAVAKNWNIVWQSSLNATAIIPYPREFSPTILSSPIIAVACSTSSNYWNNQALGYANQHIESGLIGMGLARSNAKRIIIADEISIIEFPFEVDYRLSIDLFKSVATIVTISVYEYIRVIE